MLESLSGTVHSLFWRETKRQGSFQSWPPLQEPWGSCSRWTLEGGTGDHLGLAGARSPPGSGRRETSSQEQRKGGPLGVAFPYWLLCHMQCLGQGEGGARWPGVALFALWDSPPRWGRNFGEHQESGLLTGQGGRRWLPGGSPDDAVCVGGGVTTSHPFGGLHLRWGLWELGGSS